MKNNVPICGLTPFSLQDYPEHTSCIIWFGGCNFRCAYCHNPEFVTGKKERISEDKVFSFLKKRRGLLDGVVISGGEPTLSSGLYFFMKKVKNLGFKIKLDTNGSDPLILEKIVNDDLIDYVAIDYKAPKKRFPDVTGFTDFEIFHKSLKFLCDGSLSFEVRTTVHSDLLNEVDIGEIIADLERLNFRGNYYVQNFRSGDTLLPLPDQVRLLNISTLPKPKGFSIIFRNF